LLFLSLSLLKKLLKRAIHMLRRAGGSTIIPQQFSFLSGVEYSLSSPELLSSHLPHREILLP
jgi:hypothetical protein